MATALISRINNPHSLEFIWVEYLSNSTSSSVLCCSPSESSLWCKCSLLWSCASLGSRGQKCPHVGPITATYCLLCTLQLVPVVFRTCCSALHFGNTSTGFHREGGQGLWEEGGGAFHIIVHECVAGPATQRAEVNTHRGCVTSCPHEITPLGLHVVSFKSFSQINNFIYCPSKAAWAFGKDEMEWKVLNVAAALWISNNRQTSLSLRTLVCLIL